MALTPQILANEARILSVVRASRPMRAAKATILAPINYPTDGINANQAVANTVHRSENPMEVNKATNLVVCKGRVAHPNILVWTATLDGHELLFIQLQTETLVYDFAVEQWYTWGSGESSKLAVQRGQNWNADLGAILGDLGGNRVSNIVCGDDTTGTLYFMDPELPEDYTSYGIAGRPFRRVITGQLAMRGHDYVTLDAVELTGSNGQTDGTTQPTVELQISDDRGISYWSAGTETIADGSYNVTVSWRSLGSYTGSGRLLRFVDYGAIARVDGLDTPDDA